MIVELVERPELVATVVGWIQREWPQDRSDADVERRLCGEREAGKLPCALVALAGDRPIGFVSLVTWEKGIAQGRAHWIDALYVLPEERGKGVAHRLLAAAERKAGELGIERLFALTEIPALYRKAGWDELPDTDRDNPRDVVVTKRVG